MLESAPDAAVGSAAVDLQCSLLTLLPPGQSYCAIVTASSRSQVADDVWYRVVQAREDTSSMTVGTVSKASCWIDTDPAYG